MTDYRLLTPWGSSSLAVSPSPLGRGGEGAVFDVLEHSLPDLPEKLVAKIYHDVDSDQRAKLVDMIDTAPSSDSVAWPYGIVVDADNVFRGYVMRKLEADTMRQWSDLAHSAERRKNSPDFSVQYAVAACLNLAEALLSVHEAGHRIGDINESNAFVGVDATVTLVDTDSSQVQGKSKVFRCAVGKPEYTAPELSRGSLREQERTEASDTFAFAVMAFQMLTGGAHPTDGIIDADMPVVERIRAGVLPTLREEDGFKPVPRIPSRAIPSRLQNAIEGMMRVEPDARVRLADAAETFSDVLDNLEQCKKQSRHYFDKRDGTCGWCAHTDRGLPDVWSPQSAPKVSKQRKLSPVAFEKPQTVPVRAPRAPVTAVRSYNAPSTAINVPSPQGSAYAPPMPGASGSSGSPYQVYQSPSVPQAPEVPKKIRGKMVVQYANGTYGARPRLSSLFRQSPRMAREAVAVEWPAPFRFWWATDQLPANIWGVIIGFIVGLAPAGLLAWFAPMWLSERIIDPGWYNLASISVWGCAAVAALCVAILFVSALLNVLKMRKSYGSAAKGSRKENAALTALRFVSVGVGSVFFLPVLIFSLIFAVLSRLVPR